ncbi:MAG: quinolinate synthase NadA [Alphaproteobacteria bacterium]|nr:quinolinate synthase NadA [Alphaproteobacteria bacterium]
MSTQNLAYTNEVANATAPVYEKLSSQYNKDQWEKIAPYIYEINRLKAEKNATILVHNYMTPDIFYGIGDIVGDSLMLARKASQTNADIIVQCGVHFMAETAKILCPDKKVIIPDPKAGCSLANSITAKDVRDLKEKYPGIPVVTYVNTSAEVKAESDVCCTSSNALQIVNALKKEGHDSVIFTPDQYLAQNVAAQTDVNVIIYEGSCEVHELYSAQNVIDARNTHEGLVVLAHPECKPEVMAQADYAGSTAQMDDYIKKHQPKTAMLVTERSMSDNVAASNPDVKLLNMPHACPHMKRITLQNVLEALQNEAPEVLIDPDILERAKHPVDRMLELS